MEKISVLQNESYLGEGLESYHNQLDLFDVEFIDVYARAVEKVGFNYGVPQRRRLIRWAVASAIRPNPSGALIELGTGRDFTMSFVATLLVDSWGIHGIPIILCDSFEPDLPSGSHNRSGGAFSAGRQYFAESMTEVENRFKEYETVRIIRGKLPDSLLLIQQNAFSFVHVDLNDGLAEAESLETLWVNLLPGCVIVLDDFANRGRNLQREVLVDFFNTKNCLVLATPQGQGLALVPLQ